MLPHKYLAPDFEEDIFINYAHIDNVTLLEDFKGFVDRVHETLALRLRQLTGEDPKIWRDTLLEGTQQLRETIVVRLSKTVFLMCVLSPSYITSQWCQDELNEFFRRASENKGIKINNRSRIFKILKTPIAMDPRADPFARTTLPDELRMVLRESIGYEFYEVDKLTGRLREYSREYGAEYELKHRIRVDDLCQDIVRFINDEEFRRINTKCVYLAETTPELNDQRDEIRRNLLQYGYTVLPDENLPFGEAFDEKVSEYLKRSILSIHLVGSDFSTINPNPDEKEVRERLDLEHPLFAARVQKQHDLAMRRGDNDPKYCRLVWMPAGLTQRDKVNQDFVIYLQNDPAVQENAEILSGTKLEDLKTIMRRRLGVTGQEMPAQIQGKRVYLYCDKQDIDAVTSIKEFLQKRNHEVWLPFADGGQIVRPHSQSSQLCDAILIFYGSSTVDHKITDLKKICVRRKDRPLVAKGIFIGGSESPEKNQFSSVEAVTMRCFGEFSPEALQPFLDQLENGSSTGA